MINKTISHYNITEKLGEGGMGVVYKARDTKLNRDVSIKFVPDYTPANEESRARFLQEARSVAQMNHPNICQVYGIEEDESGRQFIVMEYIDGANLHEAFIKKIKDREADYVTGSAAESSADQPEFSHSKTVLSYAIQIARGLEAAHKKGITHRDVKPANIMLSSSNEIKLLDFGLAKIADSVQLTKEGTTVGTTAYMSPEQVRGEPAEPRCDIWSFGVVLYEMLSGKLPFGGDYDHSIIYSVINSDPPPLRSADGELLDGLEEIVNRCLSKDMDGRYQTMTEVLYDLQAIGNLLYSGNYSATKLTADKVNKRQKGVLAGVAGVLIIALVWFMLRPDSGQPWFSSSDNDVVHLAVLPFTNIGSDPGRQVFADGLVETLTSQLSQMEQFQRNLWVVPAGEVRSYNIASAGQAYQLFKVNYAIAGSLQPLANRLRLTLTLIDSRNLRQLNSVVIDVDENNLLELHEKSVENLLSMLNLELNPESISIINEGKTSIPEAFELYMKGLGYLQRYERVDNIEQAITAFKEAIELDTGFALAHAALGHAYWRLYENTLDRNWATLASEQANEAYRLNNRLLQAHITLGMIKTGTGRYSEAIEHFTDALSADPTNAEAYKGMAQAYESSGDLNEAEATYLRAIQLKPDNWDGYNALGAFYFRNTRYDEAKEQFRRVIELTPDNYRGYLNLGSMYYFIGMLSEARAMYEKSLEFEQTFGAASNLGTLYYAEGLYADAARAYETALEFNDTHYFLWGNLATAYYYAPGQREKARNAYLRAIEAANETLKVNENDADAIISLAGYNARVGNEEAARSYISRALQLAPDNSTVMYLTAATFEYLGEREEALYYIKKAIEAGYSISEIKGQPELQNLISDPRFSEIQE
ncbi:MAG: tetratricopeptide repeat protein [Balneolaceae bacterium]|nr:MAG: tetratricopeptide repeat protein [Balneolaceae bacterium]